MKTNEVPQQDIWHTWYQWALSANCQLVFWNYTAGLEYTTTSKKIHFSIFGVFCKGIIQDSFLRASPCLDFCQGTSSVLKLLTTFWTYTESWNELTVRSRGWQLDSLWRHADSPYFILPSPSWWGQQNLSKGLANELLSGVSHHFALGESIFSSISTFQFLAFTRLNLRCRITTTYLKKRTLVSCALEVFSFASCFQGLHSFGCFLSPCSHSCLFVGFGQLSPRLNGADSILSFLLSEEFSNISDHFWLISGPFIYWWCKFYFRWFFWREDMKDDHGRVAFSSKTQNTSCFGTYTPGNSHRFCQKGIPSSSPILEGSSFPEGWAERREVYSTNILHFGWVWLNPNHEIVIDLNWLIWKKRIYCTIFGLIAYAPAICFGWLTVHMHSPFLSRLPCAMYLFGFAVAGSSKCSMITLPTIFNFLKTGWFFNICKLFH